MNKLKVIIPILLVLTLNGLAGAGFYHELISAQTALSIFWAQCAMLGIGVFFIYAKHLLVFFILLLLVGLAMGLRQDAGWQDLQLPITFWGLYSVCWLFYFEFSKTRTGQGIRRAHPLLNFLFYLFYMTLTIALCFGATLSIYRAWDLVTHIPADIYTIFFALAAFIPTLSIAVLRIIDIIGASHVFHFLIGTYHHPASRERVVLFLDMVGSSAIAERLGPEKSAAFIARFIFDASLAFRIKGGDIINYTGDGLVVLWPMNKAHKALESADMLGTILKQNDDLYKKQFGTAPSFRIGVHAGDVIISQIGEEKLFLGLYGDTVNTAARLEQMCKELDVPVLFSKTVRQYLSVKLKDSTKHLGRRDVRGRQEKIDVYTMLWYAK